MAIIVTIVVFLLLTLSLVGLLLYAKAKLSPSGKITIKINGEKEIEVDGGGTLLTTLECRYLSSISLWWRWNMYSVYLSGS